MFRKPHPDQIVFDWSRDAQMQRIIEARATILAERQALRWKLRLTCVEAVMTGALALTADILFGHPLAAAVRAGAIVVCASLLGGIFLGFLSGPAEHLLASYHQWRAK